MPRGLAGTTPPCRPRHCAHSCISSVLLVVYLGCAVCAVAMKLASDLTLLADLCTHLAQVHQFGVVDPAGLDLPLTAWCSAFYSPRRVAGWCVSHRLQMTSSATEQDTGPLAALTKTNLPEPYHQQLASAVAG